MVAAGSGGEGFKVGHLVEEAGDAAGGFVDGDAEAVACEGDGCAGLFPGRGPGAAFFAAVGAEPDDFVAEGGDVVDADPEFRDAGFLVGSGFGDGAFGGLEAAFFGFFGLDPDGYFAGTFPGEGIGDDYGDAVAGSVDSFGDGGEGVGLDFAGGPADYVVILLSIFVDDADAGACGEVVELVEEDFFPVFGEFVAGVGFAVEPGEGGPFFGVEDLFFAFAHVALVVGLGGHDTAVEFEIELAFPGGDGDFAGNSGRGGVALGDRGVVPFLAFGVDLRFDGGEEGLGEAELHFGVDGVGGVGGGWCARLRSPVEAFVEDGAGGAAAVVAYA